MTTTEQIQALIDNKPIHVTDWQVQYAQSGEKVTIFGHRFIYTLTCDRGKDRNPFQVVFKLGTLSCDEENLRLFTFV